MKIAENNPVVDMTIVRYEEKEQGENRTQSCIEHSFKEITFILLLPQSTHLGSCRHFNVNMCEEV